MPQAVAVGRTFWILLGDPLAPSLDAHSSQRLLLSPVPGQRVEPRVPQPSGLAGGESQSVEDDAPDGRTRAEAVDLPPGGDGDCAITDRKAEGTIDGSTEALSSAGEHQLQPTIEQQQELAAIRKQLGVGPLGPRPVPEVAPAGRLAEALPSQHEVPGDIQPALDACEHAPAPRVAAEGQAIILGQDRLGEALGEAVHLAPGDERHQVVRYKTVGTGAQRNYVVVKDPAAPPMWARFYEIGTNRAISA